MFNIGLHKMTFNSKRHGEFHIEVCEDVALVSALGPWNVECVQEFEQVYRDKVYQSGMNHWADIIQLHGESLFVPDAEKRLHQGITRAAAIGLEKVFLVLEQSTVITTARMQLENLYRGIPVELYFADTLSEAIQAANQAGYQVTFNAADAFFSRLFN